MILGFSFLDNRLLMAAYPDSKQEARFVALNYSHRSVSSDRVAEEFWENAGEQALELYAAADKIVIAIPGSQCFIKRLEIDRVSAGDDPAYYQWLASTQLPGKLSQYQYGFETLRQSFDKRSAETVIYAAPAAGVNALLAPFRMEDGARRISVLPEPLGLCRALNKSLSRDDIPQAAIVNCGQAGATVVYMRDGRFSHFRHFSARGADSDLATDVETYLLSRADSAESLPLVITGFTGDFRSNWTPVVPAFLSIHDLEFAAAWGIADYLGAGV